MAGGIWTTQNKVRPGVYIDFVSAPKQIGTPSDRGIVTMALPLSWGPEKQVVEINAGDDVYDVLGYDIASLNLLLVREALKRAKTLLLYRINDGTKATATVGTNLTVTAKYSGVRGNDILIVVQPNIDDETKYDVKTLVDGREVDLQTVGTVEELKSNTLVEFSGSGVLTATAGTPLTGGTDGQVVNQDHMDYLAIIEAHDWNTMALPSDDATLKPIYAAYVKRLRENDGKYVQVVLANYPAADYEGVISVKNGVVLADGTTLTAEQAVAWVSGATAGAAINQSLTYTAYDDAIDVDVRYSNTEIIKALNSGELVFVYRDGKAVIEQDINTFRSYTPTKGKERRKNRVIRVLDGIANDFKRIFEAYYVGKVNNNDDGRNLFRKECINYLDTLQNMGAVQNFKAEDIAVLPGQELDAVYVEVYVQPVDAVEKIYMKVIVR